MAWNGQRRRVDIDGASEILQRKERKKRKRGREEKDYGSQGFKKKKTRTHTITIIIFVMAIIYRALIIFQTVPYPRELIEASERSMR